MIFVQDVQMPTKRNLSYVAKVFAAYWAKMAFLGQKVILG